MTRAFLRMLLCGAATAALPLPVQAFHGGGHGGGGGGGGFHGGGGGGFRGGGGGGFREGGGMGGFHPGGVGVGMEGAHPGGFGGPRGGEFNRTPSFSTPHSIATGGNARFGEGDRFNGAGRFNENHLNNINSVNRTNAFSNNNRFNSVNNVNRFGNNNINNTNINNRMGVGWRNPYMGYHQNWHHGYWNGNFGNGWGWRPYGGGYGFGGLGGGFGYGLGWGLGMGAGWGLSSWMFGPMLNNWGYSSYYNPYYGGIGGNALIAQQPLVYDYSQPIDPEIAPTDDSVVNQANTTFDNARDAFRAGDYPKALSLVDEALKATPNDAALHEFRGLTLFALQRYDEAAAVLYAVLSVGPGWDWTTLISLYADPQTYTNQLRALEQYCNANPNSAAAHFVLAYQYLTQGHAEAAVRQLKAVSTLQPKDQLTAQLINQIQHTDGAPNTADTPPAQSSPPNAGNAPDFNTPAPGIANSAPAGQESKLVGQWSAQGPNNTVISLTFPDKGRFTWKVLRQGKDQEFVGNSTYENGVLSLVQDQNGNAMAGNVVWTDDTHFTFKIVGAPPNDPGLTFNKVS